jgi:hypothetical protein
VSLWIVRATWRNPLTGLDLKRAIKTDPDEPDGIAWVEVAEATGFTRAEAERHRANLRRYGAKTERQQ